MQRTRATARGGSSRKRTLGKIGGAGLRLCGSMRQAVFYGRIAVSLCVEYKCVSSKLLDLYPVFLLQPPHPRAIIMEARRSAGAPARAIPMAWPVLGGGEMVLPVTSVVSTSPALPAMTPEEEIRLRKTPWQASEDTTIQSMVAKVGSRWELIASLLPGRSEDAVRNRYHRLQKMETVGEGLQKASRPTRVSGHERWTAEEDRLILEGVAEFGLAWRKVAARLQNRSDSSVRNRYGRLTSDRVKVASGGGSSMANAGTSPAAPPPAASPLAAPPAAQPPEAASAASGHRFVPQLARSDPNDIAAAAVKVATATAAAFAAAAAPRQDARTLSRDSFWEALLHAPRAPDGAHPTASLGAAGLADLPGGLLQTSEQVIAFLSDSEHASSKASSSSHDGERPKRARYGDAADDFFASSPTNLPGGSSAAISGATAATSGVAAATSGAAVIAPQAAQSEEVIEASLMQLTQSAANFANLIEHLPANHRVIIKLQVRPRSVQRPVFFCTRLLSIPRCDWPLLISADHFIHCARGVRRSTLPSRSKSHP